MGVKIMSVIGLSVIGMFAHLLVIFQVHARTAVDVKLDVNLHSKQANVGSDLSENMPEQLSEYPSTVQNTTSFRRNKFIDIGKITEMVKEKLHEYLVEPLQKVAEALEKRNEWLKNAAEKWQQWNGQRTEEWIEDRRNGQRSLKVLRNWLKNQRLKQNSLCHSNAFLDADTFGVAKEAGKT